MCYIYTLKLLIISVDLQYYYYYYFGMVWYIHSLALSLSSGEKNRSIYKTVNMFSGYISHSRYSAHTTLNVYIRMPTYIKIISFHDFAFAIPALYRFGVLV